MLLSCFCHSSETSEIPPHSSIQTRALEQPSWWQTGTSKERGARNDQMREFECNPSVIVAKWATSKLLMTTRWSVLLSPCSCRAVWHTPLCLQRRPATRCTVGRWCQSCCLSAMASRTCPMAWTACTVSTTITLKGTSSHQTLALFYLQDTIAHTSCQLSMAGEDSQATASVLFFSLFPSSFSIILLTLFFS